MLRLPIRDVPLDVFLPEFGIFAADLGRIGFD
jgi:hypothetical protein